MLNALTWPYIAWSVAFWAACGLLLHAYVIYPLLVRYWGKLILPKPPTRPRDLGNTVLLIAAHNEEEVIEERLRNALDTLPGTLRIVVASDGSTDGTDEIVERYMRQSERIELVRVDDRLGKNHALNVAIEQLRLKPNTVVVFSDANALYREDAVERMRARLTSGPACVVGKLIFTDAVTGTARAEGLYWRYENAIKASEGRIGRLSVANGAIFATTAEDIGAIPLDVSNDFWVPITLLGTERAVVYEDNAIAFEKAPKEGREEFLRKVRMANRQMRCVIRAWGGLDAPTRFQLVSHKVIRWLGIPLVFLALTAAALLSDAAPVYQSAAFILTVPILVGAVGFVGRLAGVRIPVADLGAHFLLVHAAALFGVIGALSGRRYATWKQASSPRNTRAGPDKRVVSRS